MPPPSAFARVDGWSWTSGACAVSTARAWPPWVALLMKAKGKARSVKVSGCTPSVVDLLHREGIDRLFPLHPGTVPAVSGR